MISSYELQCTAMGNEKNTRFFCELNLLWHIEEWEQGTYSCILKTPSTCEEHTQLYRLDLWKIKRIPSNCEEKFKEVAEFFLVLISSSFSSFVSFGYGYFVMLGCG